MKRLAIPLADKLWRREGADMTRVAIIGFGEAGRALSVASPGIERIAYDRKPLDESALTRARLNGTLVASTAEEALQETAGALCLVTADQATSAARSYAALLPKGSLWLDMNSVSPETKRQAAKIIEAAGGRYVDVAVMSPVEPARLDVPLLVCGIHAEAGVALLRSMGFGHVRQLSGGVGTASAIKMIRSVMVKGIEALTAECVLAASAAGVMDEVFASLDASAGQHTWAERTNYNLDRMLLHGERRAAEMEEVVRTLDELGTGSTMSRGTVERQRAIGGLTRTIPAGLAAKIDFIARTNP